MNQEILLNMEIFFLFIFTRNFDIINPVKLVKLWKKLLLE